MSLASLNADPLTVTVDSVEDGRTVYRVTHLLAEPFPDPMNPQAGEIPLSGLYGSYAPATSEFTLSTGQLVLTLVDVDEQILDQGQVVLSWLDHTADGVVNRGDSFTMEYAYCMRPDEEDDLPMLVNGTLVGKVASRGNRVFVRGENMGASGVPRGAPC